MMMLVLVAACGSNETKTPSQESIETVKAQVEQMQPFLPMEVSPMFKLEKVSFDTPTNTMVYTYRFNNPASKPDEAALESAKKAAMELLKTDPNTEKLINDGINIQYNYYNPDGALSYTLAITYKDFE